MLSRQQSAGSSFARAKRITKKSTPRRVAKFSVSWIASSLSGLHLFVQTDFGTRRVIRQRILDAPTTRDRDDSEGEGY